MPGSTDRSDDVVQAPAVVVLLAVGMLVSSVPVGGIAPDEPETSDGDVGMSVSGESVPSEIDDAPRTPTIPHLRTGFARWSHRLPTTAEPVDASGPDEYVPALRRYVETLGADLDEDQLEAARAQAAAMDPAQSRAMAHLLNVLVARHQVAEAVFGQAFEASDDPALSPADHARLAASQRAVAGAVEEVAASFPQPRLGTAAPSASADDPVGGDTGDACLDEPYTTVCHDENGTRVCFGPECGIGASKRPGESPKACVDTDLFDRAGCETTCDEDGTRGPDPGGPDEVPETGPVATCGAGPLPEVEVCRAVLVNLNSRDNVHGDRTSWDSNDCRPGSFAFQFDLAGDDIYRTNAGGAGLVHVENVGPEDDWDVSNQNPYYHPSALAVDLFGDDTYENRGPWDTSWGAWAGAGFLGVGGLVDLRGQDEYKHDSCTLAGTGSGILGSGMLVDAAGHDRYVTEDHGGGRWDCHRADIQTHWEGLPSAITGSVAVTGTALLLDVAGSDEYLTSEWTCQWTPQVDDLGACHGSAVGTDPEEHLWADFIWGDVDVLPGETSLGTAAAALVDVAGDDTYRGTNGAVVAAYAAEEETKVDLGDKGCDFEYLGLSWRLGRSCTARAGEVPHASPATLLDLSGDDVYRGANGFGGLLYDGQGSDLYRDDLQPTTLPPFYTQKTEDPVGDESWTSKPLGTPGAQIDETPVKAAGSSSSWLTSPPQDVGNGATRACTPGVDRTDLWPGLRIRPLCSEPVSRAEAIAECVTDVTTDAGDDIDDPGCEVGGAPDAGRGPNETDPQVDTGRVFWLEGRKLMMQDVFTQAETPRVLAYDAVDYRASPTLVAWVDSDENLVVYDRVADERRYLAPAHDCYETWPTYQCHAGPDHAEPFEANCYGTDIKASEDDGDDDAYLFDVDGRNVVWAGTDGGEFFRYGATDNFVHCLYIRGVSGNLFNAPSCVDDLRISRHRIACVAHGDDEPWPCFDRGVAAYTIRRIDWASRGLSAVREPLRCHDATEVAIDASVVAWIGEPWNENENVVSAVDLDEIAPQPDSHGPRRVYQVGTTGGPEEGLAVSGSTILWNKAVCGDPWELEEEDTVCKPGTSIVGRDIGHLRGNQELCKRGVRYGGDCLDDPLDDDELYPYGTPEAPMRSSCVDGDDWCGTDDRPVPTVALGGAEFVVSDPALDQRSAVDPEASRNVVTWTVCEDEADGSRCPAGRTDVRYAYVVGPEVAGDRVVGGLAQCWNTAEAGEGPDYLKSRDVGSPDLDDDGLGDCWASHYGQLVHDALDLVSDLDCDTLNNLAEFRWGTHPIYDVPPLYALERDACKGSVPTEIVSSTPPEALHERVYPHGRDLDMDYLIDGYEARYIARANGEDATLDVGDAGEIALNATHGVALYHPLKDHDSDGDGVRDMEDLNSDSQVSDDNPTTDTIQDGIEVWLLGTFPDRGDSDCGMERQLRESDDFDCHSAQDMSWPDGEGHDDEIGASADCGTGDGVSDNLELWYWTVVVWADLTAQEAAQTLRHNPEEQVTGDEIIDEEDNVLLDPDIDGDSLPDAQDGIDATLKRMGCADDFDPVVQPQARDDPPGALPDGNLTEDDPSLADVIDQLRQDYPACSVEEGQQSQASPSEICPSPIDPDSDDDGVQDGRDPEPCDEGVPEEVAT